MCICADSYYTLLCADITSETKAIVSEICNILKLRDFAIALSRCKKYEEFTIDNNLSVSYSINFTVLILILPSKIFLQLQIFQKS